MTDPNPLKQAAEETKSRKLAEAAEQQARDAAFDAANEEVAFQETIKLSRELIPMSYEIVDTIDIAIPAGEDMDSVFTRNSIVLDFEALDAYRNMARDAKTGVQAVVALVTPSREFSGQPTLNNLKRGLFPLGNFPDVLMLAEIAKRTLPQPQRWLLGFGASCERTTTDVPPRTVVEYPVLQKSNIPGIQASLADGEEVLSGRPLIPLILAIRPVKTAASVAS